MPPSSQPEQSPARYPFWQGLPLLLLLFVVWVILSGKLDAFHLSAGLASAAVLTASSARLFALGPAVGAGGRHPAVSIPWLRLLLYLPWLVGQIFISSLQVARLVLSPKLAIDPRVLRFRCSLPHNVARATLANSITLTPGTVTLDVEGDDFLIHALSDEAASSLMPEGKAEGEMELRVAKIYASERHRS